MRNTVPAIGRLFESSAVGATSPQPRAIFVQKTIQRRTTWSAVQPNDTTFTFSQYMHHQPCVPAPRRTKAQGAQWVARLEWTSSEGFGRVAGLLCSIQTIEDPKARDPEHMHHISWLDRKETIGERGNHGFNFKRTTLGKEVMRSAARSANVTATTAANKSKIVVLLDMWVQSRLNLLENSVESCHFFSLLRPDFLWGSFSPRPAPKLQL